MSMTAAEVLGTMYQRMGEQDWEGMMEMMADDFKVIEPDSLPYGGVWEGKDAMQRLYPAVVSCFDEFSPVIKEVIGGVEWATVVVDLTLVSKTTGRRFVQTVMEVGRIQDGKVAELQIHYFDTAEIAREIGAA
ncbi:MAG: nuclear transport factor 2 family protein [Porticoccaceae bacterium]